MLDKLNQDIIKARKESNDFELKTLTTFKAEFQANSKAKKPRQDDEIALSYYNKLLKALEMYRDTDYAMDSVREVDIIKRYIPKQLESDEIEAKIVDYLSDKTDGLNKGLVIKNMISELGKQNAKLISQIVNKLLT
jgi:uncharacterized protein YqeY